MDAVDKYRLNRIKRMEQKYGKYHGPKVRFDDDDDTNNKNGGSGGGGHGNTRIPYGLCQREGIDIKEGWTPRDAWSALEGKGYSASSVYKELKSSGKVAPKGSGGTRKSKYSSEESAKIISDFKGKQDEIESATAEYEEVVKQREKAQKAFKRRADKVESLTRAVKWHERMYDLDELYGSNPEEYEKRRAERNRMYDELRKETDKATKAADKKKGLETKESELKDKISRSEEERDQMREKYNDLVKENPTYEKVGEYRGYEQDKGFLEEKSAELKRKVAYERDMRDHFEAKREYAKEKLASMSPEDAGYRWYESDVGTYNELYEKHKKLMSEAQEKLKPYDDQIAELDRKMDSAKKSVASEGEDAWNRSYEVHKDESYVKKAKPEKFTDFEIDMGRSGVEYNQIEKYAKVPDDDTIISHVGGGDRTSGSCASVAFAYLANKAGYNVLDYRDGSSRSIMARSCTSIVGKLGGRVESDTNDFKVAQALLSEVEEGKEYYFTAGQHAAVVRKNQGKLEYLELQNDGINGWCSLNDASLKSRFACKRSHSSYGRVIKHKQCIIEASKIVNNQEFVSFLGYVNTAKDKQKKGRGGSAK